jgi:hypothetical protein
MSDKSSNDLATELELKIVDYNKARSVDFKTDDAHLVADKNNIIRAFEALYLSSLNDDYYFFDCPLEVYKKTFSQRFNDFKKRCVDADKEDLIQSDLKKLYEPVKNREINLIEYHDFSHEIERFQITLKKKKTYLIKELSKMGIRMSSGPEENASPYDDVPLDDEVRFGDIRDKDVMLTSNQVILLLEEFSFFTNERLMNVPATQKAKLLRKITGLDEQNLRKNISRLENSPSSNGEKYEKDVLFVKSLLEDLKPTNKS